jgi:hypothetical protein
LVAAQAQTDVSKSFGQVNVRRTSVAELDKNHVRVAVELTAITNKNITIENLRISSLRLNGLPVYAEPLAQQLDLQKGQETALPPIYVTARLRDLTSLEPLKQMVENQNVHVDGQVVAAVKVSFVEKLALHTFHPRVQVPVSEDVPVSFGPSPLARQAALGVLTVLEVGMKTQAVAQAFGFESPWVRDLKEQAKDNLLQIISSFSLKEHGTDFPVALDQIGFRLSSGQIVTTAEAKDPWNYDTDFLGRIKSGEAKLDKKSIEIQILPSDKTQSEAQSLLLTRKDFKMEVRGSAEKDALIINKDPDNQKPDYGKVKVLRRASPDSVAIVVLQAPPAVGGYHAAPDSVMQQGSWDKVAVYRMLLDDQNRPSIEVVQLSAHREGQGIRLDEPVDPSFFGSPILVPEGVLGFVQDEQAGAFLPSDIATAAVAADATADGSQTADAGR